MKKNPPVFYLFITLIIFSIIWILFFRPKSVTELNTNFLNLFPKQNINEIAEITTIAQNDFTVSLSTTQMPISTKDPFNTSDLSSGDYSQLVNLNDFKFLYSVECTTNGQHPNLLIAVHTAPSNVENRQAIRETWGMQRNNMKLVFMMGLPEKPEEINIIESEHEKYKDIVQGNFKDTYKNLTYKHVMVLKYAVYHCPKVNYLLKTDDDVFINMPILLPYLHDYNNDNIAKARELIYCFPMIMSPAIREKNKWQVTYEQFADKFYPPYCSGFVELFTSDTVLRLYRAAQITRFLWVDDAFVTGIARQAAKIKITPIPHSLRLENNELDTIIKINNSYPNMIYPFLTGPPNIHTKSIRDLWNIITNRKKE